MPQINKKAFTVAVLSPINFLYRKDTTHLPSAHLWQEDVKLSTSCWSSDRVAPIDHTGRSFIMRKSPNFYLKAPLDIQSNNYAKRFLKKQIINSVSIIRLLLVLILQYTIIIIAHMQKAKGRIQHHYFLLLPWDGHACAYLVPHHKYLEPLCEISLEKQKDVIYN